jgi:hypothetical protein
MIRNLPAINVLIQHMLIQNLLPDDENVNTVMIPDCGMAGIQDRVTVSHARRGVTSPSRFGSQTRFGYLFQPL